jgi:integrase
MTSLLTALPLDIKSLRVNVFARWPRRFPFVCLMPMTPMRMWITDWLILAVFLFEVPSVLLSRYSANSFLTSATITFSVLTYFVVRFAIRSSGTIALLEGILGICAALQAGSFILEFVARSQRLRQFGLTDLVAFRSGLFPSTTHWTPPELLTPLLLALPFICAAVAYLWFSERKHQAFLMLLLILPVQVALNLSLSRAVFASTVLFYVIACGLMIGYRVLTLREGSFLLAGALCAVVLILACETGLYPGIFGAYAGSDTSQVRSTQGRLSIWKRSLDVMGGHQWWWDLHLKPFFGLLRAIEVSSQLVASYIDARQQEGAENATINRELAALKRLFRLAQQSTPPKVNAVPYIAMLKENNTRTGFLESKQHDALAAETGKIGLWLRTMFEVGYTFGWRHEELLALRVRQVNLSAGTIRLEPGTTKNDQGREVSMTLPVKALLTQCVQDKNADDHVFTREHGRRVRDFRGSWENACEAAKVPGLLFHDLRRTAARNLRRAGVAEGVIMKIGGWKTRSVFERYAIVSQSDIRDAMTRLEAGQQRDNAEAAQEKKAAELQFGQGLGRGSTNTGALEQITHSSASHLN